MSWINWFKSSKPRAAFLEEYVAANAEKIPGIRPIDQLTFVILDTETTGFDPNSDHVLSFGGIKIKKNILQIADSVEWYPKTDRQPNATATVHGILQQRNQLELKEFAVKLVDFLGNGILVGHHVGFDLSMLAQILKPFGLSNFLNPVIDTMQFAIRLDYGPLADLSQIAKEPYSLDQLCTRFGIQLDDRHTAAGDAFLTAQLFLKMLKEAEKKGIRTCSDLFR